MKYNKAELIHKIGNEGYGYCILYFSPKEIDEEFAELWDKAQKANTELLDALGVYKQVKRSI